MGWFKRRQPVIEIRDDDETIDAALLKAIIENDAITRKAAMSIPAVAACVNRIADTVASLDVKLFKKTGDSVEEVENDIRVSRINGDTGDTLNGYQMKRAMVVDSLLGKGGYAFINRNWGEVVGLHYVPCSKISFQRNDDPIFKTYQIFVNGKRYEGYNFIKLLRNTENGYKGSSIITESEKLFEIVAASQDFEKAYSKRGGAKKGYIQAQSRMEKDKMQALKEAYRNMYGNGTENIVVLNEGLKFQEASASSQELQMNENKETNGADICKIFGIPPKIITGGASEEDKRLYYEGCINPILVRFAKALNDVLLNPNIGEEEYMYFAFDDVLLTRANIETRYKAYETGLKNGFLQLDDIRERENLPKLGLDFVKLGLQDVLLYPENGDIYTPNMGVFANLKEKKVMSAPGAPGRSEDESIDKE